LSHTAFSKQKARAPESLGRGQVPHTNGLTSSLA
jgi:hypothetical protein